MTGRKKYQHRKSAQIARDQRKIAMFYLEGWNQTQIADELEISQATVSRDLKVIQKKWQEAAIMDLDEIKRRELQKLDEIELEFLDAWRRSKGEVRKTIVKAKGTGPDEGPNVLERSTVIEYKVGDGRYLEGALRCIERRCKLLGIDAPQDFKVGVSGGMEINDERVRAAIDRLERS